MGPTITPTPSDCPSESLAVKIQASSTNIKVGEAVTVSGAVNRYIGGAYYHLVINDVGFDQNAGSDFWDQRGLSIINNGQIISKEYEVADFDMQEPNKGVSVVLRAEQAGSITVTLGIDGETWNDCAGFPIWNNVNVHSYPLTITVTAP